MGKGAFVGIDGIARKIKGGFIGIESDIPIYEETTGTVAITADNIADYFEVTNGTYYFAGSGSTFTSNNKGVHSSTASTVLKAKKNISDLSFDYSYSSEANYDKFTLKVAGTTVQSAVSGATTSKSYSGSINEGQTIEFTYSKDGSTNSNNDQCTFSNMKFTDTVKTLVGTEKKSVARKIINAYIGVGGVARPCWGGKGLKYYGKITDLTTTRYDLAGASNNSYALFAGGHYGFSSTANRSTVDAYNGELVKSSAANLTNDKYNLAGISFYEYALFAGGTYGTAIYDNKVEAYDENLVKVSSSYGDLYLQKQTTALAGEALETYAIFAGGSGGGIKNNAVAFNRSLVRTTDVTSLSVARGYLAAAKTPNHVLFAGGSSTSGYSDAVDAYNSNLVKTTATSLSVARYNHAGGHVGKYALFAGGYSGVDTVTDAVDAYDENLVRSVLSPLSVARQFLASASSDDFVMFAGGNGEKGSSHTDVAESYNSDLVKTIHDPLSASRYGLAGACKDNYMLFAGGMATNAYSIVDAYVVS